MSHGNAGKKTFISQALDWKNPEDFLGAPQVVQLNGESYYLRLRMRTLDDIDPRDPSSFGKALKSYKESSKRTDAGLGLYDVTRRESLDVIPMALRRMRQVGKPCLMVSTKEDCDVATRQLDPDAVERKTRLVVGADLKTARCSKGTNVPKACLERLISDVLCTTKASGPKISSMPESRSSYHTRKSPETFLRSRAASEVSSIKHEYNVTAELPRFSRSNSSLLEDVAVTVDTNPEGLALSRQQSQGSVPFSPRTFEDADSITQSISHESPDALNPEALKALPSHIMEVVTFEELVARVCFRDNQKDDIRFDFNFLVFYRFFASPLRLLAALISVYTSTKTIEEGSVANQDIATRVLQFLSQWITAHPGDFTGHETEYTLEEFLNTFDQSSEFFPVATQIILAAGMNELEVADDDKIWSLPEAVDVNCGNDSQGLERVRSAETDASASDLDARLIFRAHSTMTLEAMGPSHTPASSVDHSTIPYNVTNLAQRQSALLTPISHLPFTKGQWRQLMAQPEDLIAQELTRIDWIMFSAMKPRDLVRHITISSRERSRYQELESVTRMTDHFNHIAYWTTNLILLRDKPKHRALALEKLIRVARKLREMNNYNSLGAVVAGIHRTAVHRLAATRELVPPELQKNFLKLEVLMSTQKGHSTYRLAWENTTGPRIPFLPLHRRDLVVAEQGNKTWVTLDDSEDAQDQRINWNKFNVLGGMLWDIHNAQGLPYDKLDVNEEIRSLILDGDIVKDDDKLYDRSTDIESSGSSAFSATIAMRKLQTSLARYGLADSKWGDY